MVPDAEAFPESKSLAEPGRRRTYIIIGQLWNNHTRWHGSVRGHGC